MPPAFESAHILAARVRVTLDCPECAAAIPVNGMVEQVLCGACQAVVPLDGGIGWNRILTYGRSEPCLEHGVLVQGGPVKAMDYFLAFDSRDGALYRKWRNILLEVDARPLACPACKGALDPAALAREAAAGGGSVDVYCPGCGERVPLRVPSADEKALIHPECVAVACETALRGDLREPEIGETVLFSCLGCGAPLDVNANLPRILRCGFCDATSYLPDALWLRLHPAQRKRPFYFLLVATPAAVRRAKKRV